MHVYIFLYIYVKTYRVFLLSFLLLFVNIYIHTSVKLGIFAYYGSLENFRLWAQAKGGISIEEQGPKEKGIIFVKLMMIDDE
jgi:hypothetical protein